MTSSHKPALRLLVFLLSFAGLQSPAEAQWNFSFELTRSGPCTAAIPTLPTFTVSSFANKSQCEYLRNIILATRACGPVYNNQGKYIGDCCVFYTCTACTGSDINTSSQVTPGEITFNAQFEGQPFFTAHQSSAFEDWAKDYKQLLESYGITSILGKNIIPNMANGIPLTNDPKVNALYGTGAADFNPDIPVQNTPNQDPNVVDLSGSSGVVQLLTTPAEQAARDKWYAEHGFQDNMIQADANNFIDENGAQSSERSWSEAAVRTAVGEAPGLAGVTGSGMINMVDETFTQAPAAINDFLQGNDAEAVSKASNLEKNIVVNSVNKTASDWAADKATEIGYCPLLNYVPGAKTVYKYVKLGYTFWENKTGN